MRLSDSRYEHIKMVVVDLFLEYNITHIPVDGFELAREMGIILIRYSELPQNKRATALQVSQDGFYLVNREGYEYIYYNDTQSYSRTNMTVLHEIGHAVLEHDEHTPSEIAEAEAAFFAKYACSAPPLVHQIHPSSAEDIMAVFGNSHEAAVYAFNYYLKWLHRQGVSYRTYELKLIDQFQQSMKGCGQIGCKK